MNRKTILLGLSAIGAIVLAGGAEAQVVTGVAGQVTATPPALPATPATPATPALPATRGVPATPAMPATPATPSARAATTAGADASATARTSFPVGTVVRDSAGVQIGTVMAADPSMASAGRVSIKTSTGFITVPAGSLTMQGDVAISARAAADVGKPTDK